MNVRKKYNAAFKLEVAKMLVDQGIGVSKIVKDMQLVKLLCDAGLINIRQNNVVNQA